jgi:hypothetical protein
MPIIPGTLIERQQRLRNQLVNKQRGRDLRNMLQRSAPRDRAMYLVLQAVVCILHVENRVGLNIIEIKLLYCISTSVLKLLLMPLKSHPCVTPNHGKYSCPESGGPEVNRKYSTFGDDKHTVGNVGGDTREWCARTTKQVRGTYK